MFRSYLLIMIFLAAVTNCAPLKKQAPSSALKVEPGLKKDLKNKLINQMLFVGLSGMHQSEINKEFQLLSNAPLGGFILTSSDKRKESEYLSSDLADASSESHKKMSSNFWNQIQMQTDYSLFENASDFVRNIDNPSSEEKPEQMLKKSKKLQNFVSYLKSIGDESVAPLVSLDQEGGVITRVRFNSDLKGIAAFDFIDEGKVLETSSNMASALSQLGFNVNNAPVVDVVSYPSATSGGVFETIETKKALQTAIKASVNPIFKYRRGFPGGHVGVVNYSRKFIEGHHQYKVLTVAKHFPGHGTTAEDSHFGFAVVRSGMENNPELNVYKELFSGSHNPDMVMVGHLYAPFLDPWFPASLSKRSIDRLRKLAGAKGDSLVVMTDDLQMLAVAEFVHKVAESLGPLEASADRTTRINAAKKAIMESFSDAGAQVMQITDQSPDERLGHLTDILKSVAELKQSWEVYKLYLKATTYLAISAGNDFLLLNNRKPFVPGHVSLMGQFIEEMLEDGQLEPADITGSVNRILALKRRLRTEEGW